jgi:hypothetical protein
MMKIIKIIITLAAMTLAAPVFAAGKEPTKPLSADTIRVLKIAARDERAVVKMHGEKAQVIKAGDTLSVAGEKDASYELRVVEIARDRLTLEEKKGAEHEIIIIRMVDGKQKMERIRKTMDKQPTMLAPNMTGTTGRKRNGIQ